MLKFPERNCLQIIKSNNIFSMQSMKPDTLNQRHIIQISGYSTNDSTWLHCSKQCGKNVVFKKNGDSMQLQNCLIIIYMHVYNIFVVHHSMLVYIVSAGWLFSIRYEHPIHFYIKLFLLFVWLSRSTVMMLNFPLESVHAFELQRNQFMCRFIWFERRTKKKVDRIKSFSIDRAHKTMIMVAIILHLNVPELSFSLVKSTFASFICEFHMRDSYSKTIHMRVSKNETKKTNQNEWVCNQKCDEHVADIFMCTIEPKPQPAIIIVNHEICCSP